MIQKTSFQLWDFRTCPVFIWGKKGCESFSLALFFAKNPLGFLSNFFLHRVGLRAPLLRTDLCVGAQKMKRWIECQKLFAVTPRSHTTGTSGFHFPVSIELSNQFRTQNYVSKWTSLLSSKISYITPPVWTEVSEPLSSFPVYLQTYKFGCWYLMKGGIWGSSFGSGVTLMMLRPSPFNKTNVV